MYEYRRTFASQIVGNLLNTLHCDSKVNFKNAHKYQTLDDGSNFFVNPLAAVSTQRFIVI